MSTQDQKPLEYNPETHHLEKKLTYKTFLLLEIVIFILISLGSFIGTYLGTDHFKNQNLFEQNLDIYTAFFKFENLLDNIMGITIVIGIITIFNFIITNFELNINSILKRLCFSIFDLVYLMISTMLGFSIALLVFAMNQPISKDVILLKTVLYKTITILILLAIIYLPIFMVFPHKDKIINFYSNKKS